MVELLGAHLQDGLAHGHHVLPAVPRRRAAFVSIRAALGRASTPPVLATPQAKQIGPDARRPHGVRERAPQ